MSLTAAQALAFRNSVKAHNADAVAAAYTGNDFQGMADLYNAAAAGPVKVWRADIKSSELAKAIVMSEYVTLTAVQQGGLDLLLQLGSGTLDASDANVRASFSTLFTGKTSLTTLTAIAQRNATAFEAIGAFLTSAAPANVSSVYGYRLGVSDVRAALYADNGTPL